MKFGPFLSADKDLINKNSKLNLMIEVKDGKRNENF